MTVKFDFWNLLFFTILIGSISINHVLINSVQSEPYIDEEFHIPQTQEFCDLNFNKWDNKITTLPGLYLVPTIISILTSSLYKCTIISLRTINIPFALGIYWVFLNIIKIKYPEITTKRRAFFAYTLTMFPINYFFTFLYYTDQLSTLLVLIMVLLSHQSHYKTSALIGAYAVFTRQTNVIWVLWTAIIVTWEVLRPDLPKWIKLLVSRDGTRSQVKIASREKRNGTTNSNGSSKGTNASQGNSRRNTKKNTKELTFLQAFSLFTSKTVLVIAPRILPFFCVMFTFVLFVLWNSGIVVGDRSAHQVSINLPQLLYFTFFVGIMLWSLIISYNLKGTFNCIWKHRYYYLILTFFSLVIVHYNTVVHPYLLADNRHYTFYIWKRFYEYWLPSRYLLVPLCIGIWFWIWNNVKFDGVLFLAFVLCLSLTIVPQKLLEYRYFIIPYYIFRLNFKLCDWKHLLVECTSYLALNCFTMYMFLYRPMVYGTGENAKVARFIW